MIEWSSSAGPKTRPTPVEDRPEARPRRERSHTTKIRATVRTQSTTESDVLVSKPDRSAFEATNPRRGATAQGTSNACDCCLTDPETGVASGKTKAAICVQDVDVQCVLQFTLIHAAGCALHRHTSRVIHRLELYLTRESEDSVTSSRQRLDAPPRSSETIGTLIQQ